MNEVLVYVYNVVQTKAEPIPPLSPDQLLIPPQILWQHSWNGGYLRTLQRGPLEAGATLSRHCFEFGGQYFDEFGELLPTRLEPCGSGGAGGLKCLDDAVSEAIGIPRVKDITDGVPIHRESVRLEDLPRTAGGVWVHVPIKGMDRSVIDALEQSLISGVGKVGKWDGHGCSLDTDVFDVVFTGSDTRALAARVSEAMKSADPPLPTDSFMTAHPMASEDAVRVQA